MTILKPAVSIFGLHFGRLNIVVFYTTQSFILFPNAWKSINRNKYGTSIHLQWWQRGIFISYWDDDCSLHRPAIKLKQNKHYGTFG